MRMFRDQNSSSACISKSFDLSARPILSWDVDFIEHRDSVVLMDFVTGRVFLLSDIGQHIISVCRGKYTVAEIAQQAAVFNKEIQPDEVLALINYLATNQILRKFDIACS